MTLTIGGNDIGFSSVIITCGRLSLIDPTGAPCEEYYTAGGTDLAVSTMPVSVAGRAFSRIQERAQVALTERSRLVNAVLFEHRPDGYVVFDVSLEPIDLARHDRWGIASPRSSAFKLRSVKPIEDAADNITDRDDRRSMAGALRSARAPMLRMRIGYPWR